MMHWQYTPYSLPLFLAAAIAIALVPCAWRRRAAPGAAALMVMLLAASEWSLGNALELTAADLSTKLFWSRLEYLGIVTLPVAWLAFALQYTNRGRWSTPRNLGLLSVIPLITVALVWTNEWHHLIWTQVGLDASGPFLALSVAYGPWFWVHVAYDYLLLLLGTAQLLLMFLRSPRLYRRQSGALLLGSLIPWLGNGLYVSGLGPVPNLDLTPFACTLSGVVFAFAIFRFRLLDIVPVARRAVVDAMSDGVMVLDIRDRLVDLNPAAERLIGSSATEVIGKPIAQVLATYAELVERFRDATEAQAEITLWADPAGTGFGPSPGAEEDVPHHYELRISSLMGRDNRLVARLVVLHDITARKEAEAALRAAHDGLDARVQERSAELARANQALQAEIAERMRAEKALRKSEERYRSLFDNVPVGLYRTSPAGEILDANPALVQLLGYPDRETLLAANVVDVHLRAEDRQQWQALIEREGVVRDFEAQIRQCDGTVIWVRDTGRIVRDADGRVLCYEGILEDITERKGAEGALEAERNLLRTLIDNLPDYIYVKDTKARFVAGNVAVARLMGAGAPEALLGKTDFEFYPEELAARYYADDRRVMQSGQTTVNEDLPYTDQSGGKRWLSVTKVPLRDAQGEIVGLVGIARDVTERKQAEESLRERNRHLELLNRAGQVFSSTLDLDDVLITVLEEVRQMLDVAACSAWLVDLETGTQEGTPARVAGPGRAGTQKGTGAAGLVCRQTTDPRGEILRGWRLAPDQGIAGWVTQHGESLIVPDTRADTRHFKGVDQQIGLEIRSILSVPLWVRQRVIGVIQVVDEEVDRFGTTDLMLLESLASAAAIAIENARLYEEAKGLHRQAQEDAETKAMLLREVNHRVGNNLAAIMGLLSTERDHVKETGQSAYQSIMEDLTSRVQGLVTVHRMLSASQWMPLQLSDLAGQVIHSCLQVLPFDKYVSVDVTSSPVRVAPDQAHNLALVINELATNTVKYALRGRDTAHVAVRIALEDDGDAVRLEFRDDGPGYPDEVLRLERHSVGMELIESIVCHTLGGELALRNDSGAVTIIRFKSNSGENSK